MLFGEITLLYMYKCHSIAEATLVLLQAKLSYFPDVEVINVNLNIFLVFLVQLFIIHIYAKQKQYIRAITEDWYKTSTVQTTQAQFQ